LLGFLLPLLLALALSPRPGMAAGETMHEVVWAHRTPQAVQKFIVFVAATKGDESNARRIDVGKPAGEVSAAFQVFSAIVPIASTDFIAIAAVGYDGRIGALSSWSGVPPTRPGQPIVVP
jgi:hypothetical protein